MKLIVLKPFKDKNDHQTIYKSGDHLITSELSRVNDLVKRGLCEIASVDDGDDGKADEKKPETISFQQKEYGLDEVKAALESLKYLTRRSKMGNLTKYDALIGELEPYTPSPLALKKALADANVGDLDAEYDAEADRKPIAIAAIKVLKKLVVLTSDSMGKSSQGYDVDELKNRIKAICSENGLEVSDFVEISSITDGSNRW